jgi:hypothetical protein
MKISELELDIEDRRACLSAEVDGSRVRITFDEDSRCIKSGDAFVVLALISAMERGEVLEVDARIPVSPGLLRRLRTIQELYVQWYPGLRVIQVQAPNTDVPVPTPDERVGCFFSGGVDSLYSVLRNLDTLDDLVLCRGLDISFEEAERWERTLASVRVFADSIGKRVQVVETDAKARFTSLRHDNHGAVLVSCGIPLGYRRLLVPASSTYLNSLPCGSHPLLDPLWSNDLTQIEHDGAQQRTVKTRAIATSELALAHLRVCNRRALYNCSACEKCLRTMVVLELIGAHSPSFADIAPGALTRLRVDSVAQLEYWVESHALAREVGHERLEHEIAALIGRFRRRERLRTLDREWFGELGVKALRRFRTS